MLFPLVAQIGSLVRIAFFLTPFICMVGKVKAITHHVHSGHLSCNITGILSHWIFGTHHHNTEHLKDYHGKNKILSQYMN